MSNESQTSYDEIPYDSHAFPQTHPNTTATIATLFGMTPARVSNCRVLELGCASGFNLIPMAATLPESRFVGIDLSSRQIAEGHEAVHGLGLTNIDLRAMSIMDVGDDFGTFDYIICHGVFSWVPAEVREKILDICSRNLAPDGVAYVSYNCYPGWHLPGLIREMMIYHTQRFKDPEKRIDQAKAFLSYLEMGTIDPNSTYARLLKEEADLIRRTPASYLYHEHLEDQNQPLYFHEFAGRAAAHGLQYVWESYQGDKAGYLRREVQETLDRLSTDVVRREQNIDFLINRRFRMSLLCHAGVTLDRNLPVERMSAFRFVATAKPESAPVNVASDAKVTFRAPRGESITVNSPVWKAAFLCMYEAAYRAFSLDELGAAVRSRLDDLHVPGPTSDEALRAEIAALMKQCVWPGLVALHVHPPAVNVTPGERPLASPVARYQARSSGYVTNLRHSTVAVSPPERHILPLLDGQHDRGSVLENLVGMAETNRIKVVANGQPLRDRAALKSILSGQLDTSLNKMALHALLMV